jgi:hypothetical protein
MKKIGEYELKGPAVEQFHALIDDNGDTPADEARAIANFDKFAAPYFQANRSFIQEIKKAAGRQR